MDVRLEHIDPSINMFRFYQVGIEPNLLGDRSIVVRWGRIGRPARMRIHASGHKVLVEQKVEDMITAKLKRGYVIRTSHQQ